MTSCRSFRIPVFFVPPILLSILFCACQDKKDFTIISDLELGETPKNHPTVTSIKKALAPIDISLTFQDQEIAQEADIIQLVNEGVIDIGIVKNDVEINAGFHNVRTLLPLFPDVMLILARDDSSATIQGLFQNRKAAMILDKAEEMNVIERFLKKNGTSTETITQIHASDSSAILEALNENDILILFASLNSPSVKNILRSWNGKIYSLDNPALMGKGSIVDGFCLAYPKALPFIIPKGTYGRWPLEPVLTFAVYDVMVCHKDLDDHTAYDMLQRIYDMRQSLSEENFEFGMIESNFESHKFSFPLHGGAMKYITRDQPTFWERESEVIGLILSFLVIGSGSMTTLYKYFKQRRKDRVDTYYQKVLYVSNQARQTMELQKKKQYLHELFLIRNNAFDQLIAENLDANEAFTIFGNLLNSAIRELEQDIQTMQKESLANLS
jgi:TRAP-type uncharacterized transport system substrate-binding protein